MLQGHLKKRTFLKMYQLQKNETQSFLVIGTTKTTFIPQISGSICSNEEKINYHK